MLVSRVWVMGSLAALVPLDDLPNNPRCEETLLTFMNPVRKGDEVFEAAL